MLPCPWDSPGKNTGVGCHFLLQCMKVKSESEVAQSCPTLSDPMDCSLPGSSIHGIFQAGVLEWGAILLRVSNSQIITKLWFKTKPLSSNHFTFQSCCFNSYQFRSPKCSALALSLVLFPTSTVLSLALLFPDTSHYHSFSGCSSMGEFKYYRFDIWQN